MNYYFEFDILPIPLNKKLRSHRWKLLNETRSWQALVYQQLKTKPRRPLSKCKITIVRHYFRELDYDGLVGSLKPVVDALVKNGIIIDDSYKITGQWNVSQEFRSKNEGAKLQLWVEDTSDKTDSVPAPYKG